MTAAFIRRLTSTNFRSYHAAQLALAAAGPVVLTGANGAGKTNLIEAISFLAPGRGLRRATLEELAFTEGDGAWAVSAEIEGMLGLATLGTGIEPPAGEDAAPTRKCRVDRETVGVGGGLRRPSARGLADARRWTRCSTARLPSGGGFSIAWCWRSMPSIPAASRRWSARCARATACSRRPSTTRIGSTRSSTKPPKSRWRSRRRAPKR